MIVAAERLHDSLLGSGQMVVERFLDASEQPIQLFVDAPHVVAQQRLDLLPFQCLCLPVGMLSDKLSAVPDAGESAVLVRFEFSAPAPG